MSTGPVPATQEPERDLPSRKPEPIRAPPKGEWPSATGWSVTANLALTEGALTDADCRRLLTEIRRTIHDRPNRTRHEMNGTVIAIGVGHPGLVDEAITAAVRIGPVDVDHGTTSCKTPEAAAYIERAADHRRSRRTRKVG